MDDLMLLLRLVGVVAVTAGLSFAAWALCEWSDRRTYRKMCQQIMNSTKKEEGHRD